MASLNRTPSLVWLAWQSAPLADRSDVAEFLTMPELSRVVQLQAVFRRRLAMARKYEIAADAVRALGVDLWPAGARAFPVDELVDEYLEGGDERTLRSGDVLCYAFSEAHVSYGGRKSASAFHYGLFLEDARGRPRVVQLTGGGEIQEVSLLRFMDGRKVALVVPRMAESETGEARRLSVQMARTAVREQRWPGCGYCLPIANCEHFVWWLVTGKYDVDLSAQSRVLWPKAERLVRHAGEASMSSCVVS